MLVAQEKVEVDKVKFLLRKFVKRRMNYEYKKAILYYMFISMISNLYVRRKIKSNKIL